MRKFFVILLIFLLLMSTVVVASAETDFSDLNHWARNYVLNLTESGVFQGYPDGTFKPDNRITIAEFIKIVTVALGEDIQPGQGAQWYLPYVEQAIELGFVEAGEFPDAAYGLPIIRGEMARMVARAAKSETYPGNLTDYGRQLTDFSSISEQYRDHVLKAYYSGIISGYPDASFQAENPATRAEASVMISRLINPALRVSVEEIVDYSQLRYEGDTYLFEKGVLYWKERDSNDQLTGSLIRLDQNAEVVDMTELVDYFMILKELEQEIGGYLHLWGVPYQDGIRGFTISVFLNSENRNDFNNRAFINFGMGTIMSEDNGKMGGVILRNITNSQYSYIRIDPEPYIVTAQKLVMRFAGERYSKSLFEPFEKNIRFKAYDDTFTINAEGENIKQNGFNVWYRNSSGFYTTITIEYMK